MKILLCTNAFENVTNGPAKFSNLALEINKLYPEHEVRVLTEDVSASSEKVIKAEINFPKILKPISQLIRMFQYHSYAMKLKKSSEYPFDVLVYNNSFIGLWSAIRLKNTIGMINDDNNALMSLKKFLKTKKGIKFWVFKQFEKLSVRFHQVIITNSNYLTETLIEVYPKIKNKAAKLYKSYGGGYR